MARFKYGVELLLWTEYFHTENVPLLEKAKQIGYDGVEIILNDPENFPISETRQKLEELGLGINFAVVLSESTNSISPDEETRLNAGKFFKKCIDVAYEVSGGGCGIGGVNYVAWGYLPGRQRTEQEWRWAVDFYREAAEYAGQKNITLCIEPVNRFETHFINTAADAVKFCRDVGLPNVKVHLDTYHMIREEKDFYRPIVETGSYLGYFHACENERGIPGTGLVRWDDVYRALRDAGYNGWITVESFTPEVESVAKLTAIWRKHAPSSDALARDGLANLKKIEEKVFE